MCSVLVTSILMFIVSSGMLISSVVMYVCKVKISLNYYISMMMIGSILLCASLSWFVIECYVRERPPRQSIRANSVQVLPSTPPPIIIKIPSIHAHKIKEYVVTIPNANISLGKSDNQLVVVTQP